MTDATEPVWIAVRCLMIILALVGGVGLVSGLVLHHFCAVSTALGWSSARVPPFTCYWMDKAAIVFILVGSHGAYMAATTRR